MSTRSSSTMYIYCTNHLMFYRCPHWTHDTHMIWVTLLHVSHIYFYNIASLYYKSWLHEQTYTIPPICHKPLLHTTTHIITSTHRTSIFHIYISNYTLKSSFFLLIYCSVRHIWKITHITHRTLYYLITHNISSTLHIIQILYTT